MVIREYFKGKNMATAEEHILRTSKEIIVKFIEIGRVSPSTFGEIFQTIYTSVKQTVEGNYGPTQKELLTESDIGK